MQNNFVTLGCAGKLTSGPWHSTTHGGGALDNSICPKKPSVCTLRANQLTPKSEVTQKSWQNGVLHAAPGSASGSSWFCIRLLLCFWRKQSYGIHQIRGKSSKRITGIGGRSQVSSSYQIDQWNPYCWTGDWASALTTSLSFPKRNQSLKKHRILLERNKLASSKLR